MGATGSGRWAYHHKKRTIEGCWAIDICGMVQAVDPSRPGSTSHQFRPTMPTTVRRRSPVRCTTKVSDDGKPLLVLSYAVGGRRDREYRGEQVVRLRTTRPNFGGVRWWFSCPCIVGGEECGRRVGKLYRPPGSRYFACRHCHDLTYESCRKSHRHDGLFALVAGEASGEAFEAVKRTFSYQSKKARRRREGPSPNLLDAFDEMFGEAEGR